MVGVMVEAELWASTVTQGTGAGESAVAERASENGEKVRVRVRRTSRMMSLLVFINVLN